MNLPYRPALVALVVALAACGSKSDAERLAAARQKLAAGDVQASVVLLKEALQHNERLAEARAMLGVISLDGGDAAAAILDLRKAVELRCEPDLCLPPLARALLASGQRKVLIGEFESVRLTRPAAQADLQTSLAVAWAGEGHVERARESLDAALAADPSYRPARLLRARALMAERQFDAALGQVAAVLDGDPRSAEAWLLRGEILQAGRQDLAGADEAYVKALEFDPRNLPAHIARVTNALEAGQRDEAQRRLAAMVRVRKDHPQTLSLQTRVAMASGQLTAAREAAQHWLRQAPQDPSAHLVSAEVERRAGSRDAAVSALRKSIGLAPGSVPARLMLGQMLLQDEQPAAALDALAPLLQGPQPVAEALGQAALAHLLLGQTARAATLIASGAKAYPGDPRFAIAASLSRLSGSDAAQALRDLQALAASDRTGLADLALVSHRLQSGDRAGALKALGSAETRQPANPLLPMWRGRILEQLSQREAARTAYQRALELDPSQLGAVQALNELDVTAGQTRAALDRMNGFVNRQTAARAPALLAQAQLMRRAGLPAAEIQRTLEAAQLAAPADAAPARDLILHHLASGQPRQALAAAQSAAEAFKGNVDVLGALGQAQLAAGESRQAVASLAQVASARPRDAQPLLLLARALSASDDLSGARARLQQALELEPGSRPAAQGLIELDVQASQWQPALQRAKAQQTREPQRPEGWMWEASVHAARKQWALAIDALKVAQAKGGGSDATLKLHAALVAAGRPADAQAVAADWMKRHPGDPSMPLTLADAAARRDDMATAESLYRKALELVPDDVPTLNNLAWVVARQGKAGGVALATRAVQLSPERGDLLDTLARALVAEKQPGKALEAQKLAVEKSPGQPEIRLNLARLAMQQGDRQLARQELQRLAGLGDRFSQQSEVAALQAQLR